jgi:hypothetical protein
VKLQYVLLAVLYVYGCVNRDKKGRSADHPSEFYFLKSFFGGIGFRYRSV